MFFFIIFLSHKNKVKRICLPLSLQMCFILQENQSWRWARFSLAALSSGTGKGKGSRTPPSARANKAEPGELQAPNSQAKTPSLLLLLKRGRVCVKKRAWSKKTQEKASPSSSCFYPAINIALNGTADHQRFLECFDSAIGVSKRRR